MSIRNFICPDGQRIPVQDCLKEGGCRLKSRCATRPYLMMCSQERDQVFRCDTCKSILKMPASNKQFNITCECGGLMLYVPSTTQLISGTKQAFLKLTTDFDIHPDDRAFMINGTKGHGVLESYDDECSLIEEKFIDGDVSGIADIITEELKIITLSDNKVTGSFKIQKALGWTIEKEETGEVYKSGKRKGEPKTRSVMKRDESKRDIKDWALQLNKYRMDYEKKYGKKVDRLRIQAIVRDGNTYIAHSRGVFRNVYYFDIPIIPDEDVEQYFDGKREDLQKSLLQGYWEQNCTQEECWDGIKCASYCEVASSCTLGKYIKQEKYKGEDMPIAGLSEVRRLPRMGKLRLGVMKKSPKSGKEYPAEVDYFVIDPAVENELENKRITDTFHKLYGDKPKSIKIMFPVADLEKIFPQYYKSYGSTTMLKCKGDGVEATTNESEYVKRLGKIRDGEFGTVVKCSGRDCPYYQEKKCTVSATLSILLPELPGAGVWQLTTGSYNSILNMNSCFEYIRSIAGRFHMIPLRLERREQEIAHDGNKTKHYILQVNLEASLAELQKLACRDPEKITMELPPVEEDRADLYLEHNAMPDEEEKVFQPESIKAVEPEQSKEVKPEAIKKEQVEDAQVVMEDDEKQDEILKETTEGVVEEIKLDKGIMKFKVGGVVFRTESKDLYQKAASVMDDKLLVWVIWEVATNEETGGQYRKAIDIKVMEEKQVKQTPIGDVEI